MSAVPGAAPLLAQRLIAAWMGLFSAALHRGGELARRLSGGRAGASREVPRQLRRALIVRLDEIGDGVLFVPFLREFRRIHPAAEITLVVKPAVLPLLAGSPYVDRVVAFDTRVPKLLRPLVLPWRARALARRQLRALAPEVAIVPRWDVDNSFATCVAYFSGAPVRIGYSERVSPRKARLNRGFDRFYTHLLHDAPQHEVARNLHLLDLWDATPRSAELELWTGDAEGRHVAQLLEERGVSAGDFLVALSPSGGHSALKQWPIQRFVELARALTEKHGARIVVVGAPGEEALGSALAQALGGVVLDLVGRTSLPQMAALLRRCDLFVGNDTGPMHVAAAVGTPVVAIFGASCHHRFHPWGAGHQVVSLSLPCGPCSGPDHRDRCMRCVFDRPECLWGIPHERVAAAVEDALQARTGALPG